MGLPEADNHRQSLSGDAPRNAATNADVGHATCHRHGLDHGSGNRPSGSYRGEFMSHIMPPRVRFAKAQLPVKTPQETPTELGVVAMEPPPNTAWACFRMLSCSRYGRV